MEANLELTLDELVKVLGLFTGAMLIAACLAGALLLAVLVFGVPSLAHVQLQLAKTPWHLSRATGVVAYLLLTASVAWGLLLSTKIIKDLAPPPFALAMHNFISWLAIGLAGFHGAVLLLDGYYNFSVLNLLIPFTGPYKPFWVGLGVIGLYLMALTSASFSWRKWLGQQGWRRLHYLTFPAYGLATLHGLIAGTDSVNLGTRAMFVGSAAFILFLTNYRILAEHRERRSMARQP